MLSRSTLLAQSTNEQVSEVPVMDPRLSLQPELQYHSESGETPSELHSLAAPMVG